MENGGISRQLKWQRKKLAVGRCRQCGKKEEVGGFCWGCREKVRTRERNRYRERVGIPLGSALRKKGRPRVKVG